MKPTLNVKVTRRWIKDLRLRGLCNKEIILHGMGLVMEPDRDKESSDKILEDLELAGLILDD